MNTIFSSWQLLSSYYSIFHEYISIPYLIGHCILYAFLFLIVGIIAVIVFRKLITTQRQSPILKWIARSYFILIPIWLLIMGGKFGLTDGLHKECKRATVKIIGNADLHFKNFIDSNLIVGELTPNQVIDLGVFLCMKEYNGHLNNLSNDKNYVTQKLSILLADGIQTKFVSEMVKHTLKDQIEKYIGIDKDASTQMLATKIKDYSKEGVFTKIANIQINVVFKPIKRSVFILLFIGLLLPIIEISIAKYKLHQLAKKSKAT